MNQLRLSRQVAPRLEPAEQFALALGASLTEMNGHRHDCLQGDTPGKSLKTQCPSLAAAPLATAAGSKQSFSVCPWPRT